MTTRELKLTIRHIEQGGYGNFDEVSQYMLPKFYHQLRMLKKAKRQTKREGGN